MSQARVDLSIYNFNERSSLVNHLALKAHSCGLNGIVCSPGDIAKINEDGLITIVDRKKDMIISSGFNVYPNEIEDYVSQHPDVIECGVIGIDDSNRGESIHLFIVKSSELLTEMDVIAYCKKGLTIYKIPKRVIFIKEIPKNNVGKILRRKLRDL